MSIAENLAEVRSRIGEAARRTGRPASEITLVAVSKTFGVDRVREAFAAGQREFGENKVQEGLAKVEATADIALRWHLIGHVQSNKAKKAATSFACIQSVDSVDLLQRIDAAAAARTTGPAGAALLEVMVQVDFAGEATKFGAPPDEAERIVGAALEARAVRLIGLMMLPPWNEDPEQTRPWFVRARQFRDRLVAGGVPREALHHLSMGMSHDYEAAIEEGSTIVRVGTAIFGKRQVVR
ncbi:MAG TPA: YggS family pyridoxal phosphate-dependent enzyme [Vicinamibacterales bacterium]|nr:YggS family pyridoxal phosphate-dependent enzyme [Vicinamibacterales bacterium]